MENVRQDLQVLYDSLKAFDTLEEMQQIIEHNCTGNCFAIYFEQNGADGILRYEMSSKTARISTSKLYINDERINNVKDDDEYIRSGLFILQHTIDRNYINSRNTSNSKNYDLNVVSMPTIAQSDTKSERLIHFGAKYCIIFNVLLLSTFLVPLIVEKQNGITNYLHIATSWSFLNGVSFFLIRFLLYTVFTTMLLIAAWYFQALGTYVPIIYTVVLFVLYMLSVMSYTYLISVCFHSVFHAKVGGLLLLIMPYVFYYSVGLVSSVANIFPTKIFMEGLKIYQTFTNKYHRISSSELTINITESSISLLSVYGILIVQCLVYCVLYNYLAYVFPGPGGLKKPYLFPFVALWKKNKHRNEYTTCERGNDAIIIQDLRKTFKKPLRVISDHLNMAIKNKQITVLLGHNGAGKTTILNMIMGIEPKDSGNITICSQSDVASYQHLIGFCPQHDVFIPHMTCLEHLIFFAELRGLATHRASELAVELLKQLKLENEKHEYVRNLSGGMRRRLSLGIAIAGHTRVVVLDEPSSGLDVKSRRELWDILLQLRKTKAVLITTHHMEEAEVLGDTICILSDGHLKCTGTSLELKHKVGGGYVLKLCTHENCNNAGEILKEIRQFIPNANIKNIVEPAIHISLPYNMKSEYSRMLQHLEESQTRLLITSISISDTSMEDVFLNAMAEGSDIIGREDSNKSIHIDVDAYSLCDQDLYRRINCWQQLSAISYKKFVYLQNEWKYPIVMLCVPTLSLLLALTLMSSSHVMNREQKLPLSLQHIKSGIVYVRATGIQDSIIVEEIERYDIKVGNWSSNGLRNVSEALLHLQNEDFAYFLQNVIGVIEVSQHEKEQIQFTIHFSGNICHSSVILLSIVDNVILKWRSTEASGIETLYAPIRRYITDVSPTRLEYYAVIVPIGMFFCMFFYVLLPFKENETGFKQLQAMPRLVFWFSTFSFDVSLHCAVCVVLFIVQWLLMPNELYSTAEQFLIVLSIFFYGVSYLPILYIFANVFRSILTISTYLLLMLIVSAIIPLITSGNIRAMECHNSLIMFLSLLPDFNLNHQLRIINERFIFLRRNGIVTLPTVLNVHWFFILSISTMIILIHVYFVSKCKCQALRRAFSCCTCRQVKRKYSAAVEEAEESLMRQEKSTVDAILRNKVESEYPLLVSDLYKFYERKAAVCGLNFAVRKQECFGLLGVNGAGKTTTFQMIAANTTISGGTIKIDGIDIMQEETQYRYRFGYCPQNDCLNDFMTAYQILAYMAKLRGIVKASDVHDEVLYWLEKLDLQKYKDSQIRLYSGGTKRKLSAALAMIGSPSLVLLDEPTTGVDPASRRFLWKCIKELQSRDRTVVLTSHRIMDECEHLCNRLAIMADGRLKCLGYVPELKKHFGSGFTIKAKIKVDDTGEVVERITKELRRGFPKSELRENHAGTLTYFIQNVDHLAWSSIFKQTEYFYKNCIDLVEDYSINETTLEDIFLKFETHKLKTDCYKLGFRKSICGHG